MSNFDLHEFNILSKRHNYFLTNNRINGFPLLKNNSIFLQKILAHRMSNSSEKKFNLNTLNEESEYQNNKIRMYQSPNLAKNRINTLQSFNMESIKPINSRKINQNINVISPERTINDNNIRNRIITPTYIKVPINVASRVSGLTNCTQSQNTPIKTENSELFRNYNELKKKKEEIFKRKMKRNSSMYRKELLKKQQDKEIKEQSVNINFLGNNDKLRIIPLKKKLILTSKSQTRLISNNNNNNNNPIKNNEQKEKENKEKKNQNIIILQKSKNLYSKKKFKTNNIFISKCIKNNKNAKTITNNSNNQINPKIKQNLEYFRLKKEKSKPTFNSPEKIKHKKFVEDYNPNISQIIYSNDRKISIKMNVLKDKNVTFEKREKNAIFEVQKVICINYKCGKKNCLSNNNNNLLKNKKIKRQKNMDMLCSIKEEEEKSKPENKIKQIEDLIEINNKKEEKKNEEIIIDKKEKEKPVSAFGSGVRSRYLSRFHKQ